MTDDTWRKKPSCHTDSEALGENLSRLWRCVGGEKSGLVKVARSDGQGFDCAIWLHKAHSMPTEALQQEVEQYLTGKETEPHKVEPNSCS